MKQYNSIYALHAEITDLISSNQLGLALKRLHDEVEHIITNPIFTSQILGSKTLDDLCLLIGKQNLAKIDKDASGLRSKSTSQPTYVYIVTNFQKSGGHSRVIESLIKARHGGLHIILATGLAGKSDTGRIDAELAQQAKVVFKTAPNGDYQQRLTWLQLLLIALAPRETFLFNHHQDSVAVAAIQPEMGLDGYFYHHGDHHFCLGVYLTHLKHIDPHPMGYFNCRDVLGIENIYIPLTADDQGKGPGYIPFSSGGVLTTCTAARSNKIEIPYFINYLDIVPLLLKTTGGRHVHIGRLTPWALYRLRRNLKRYAISPERLIYTPWVPSVWKALHEHKVDLYLTSFPYGGGLTLVEAMGAGIPVALHRHSFSRVLSGIDIAYPEVFSWRYPEELIDFCRTVTSDELIERGKLGRKQYEMFQSNEYLELILNDSNHCFPVPDAMPDTFFAALDEWAWGVDGQVGHGRLFYRSILRMLRRIRAKLA